MANRARGRLVLTVSRIVWYSAWVVILMLAVRFVLKLLGADSASRFAGVIYDLTFLPLVPFFALLPTPQWGPVVFEAFTLVAMLGYLLLGTALAKFLELFVPAEWV